MKRNKIKFDVEGFKELINSIGENVEFTTEYDAHLTNYSISFSFDDKYNEFWVSAWINTDRLFEEFETLVRGWNEDTEKCWIDIMEEIAREAESLLDIKLDVMAEEEGIIIRKEWTGEFPDLEELKQIVSQMKKVLDAMKKLENPKTLYYYLEPEKIRKLVLDAIPFSAPVEIKPIGGSYQVVIPKDGLKLLVDEELLKEGGKIPATLRVIPSEKKIEITIRLKPVLKRGEKNE